MKAKILSAAAAALMLALVLAALPLTIPRIFGFEIYNILTQSMTPAFPVGSAIYVRSCNAQDLRPGDVITFTLDRATDLVETHRVVQNDAANRQLITKGDANAQNDNTPVAYSRVVGKVAICIPILGSISVAFHSTSGRIICAAAFVLASVLWALADAIKKKESFK